LITREESPQMATVREPTTAAELWAEAQRLEEPIYEEGRRPVNSFDSFSDLASMADDWGARHDAAAVTLAIAADWDASLLRAVARDHFNPGSEGERPCGAGLLVSAALIAEKRPEERLRYLTL